MALGWIRLGSALNRSKEKLRYATINFWKGSLFELGGKANPWLWARPGNGIPDQRPASCSRALAKSRRSLRSSVSSSDELAEEASAFSASSLSARACSTLISAAVSARLANTEILSELTSAKPPPTTNLSVFPLLV